jgi:hypothetical protein
MLEIKLDDVYFRMVLSSRGEPILFSGHQETPQPTEAYVLKHYILGSQLVGGQIVIKDVRDLALRSILFSITKLVGSTNAHLSLK